MIKIKMLQTDEVLEVTPNEAHGLIDSGRAIKYDIETRASKPKKRAIYKNRQFRTSKRNFINKSV